MKTARLNIKTKNLRSKITLEQSTSDFINLKKNKTISCTDPLKLPKETVFFFLPIIFLLGILLWKHIITPQMLITLHLSFSNLYEIISQNLFAFGPEYFILASIIILTILFKKSKNKTDESSMVPEQPAPQFTNSKEVAVCDSAALPKSHKERVFFCLLIVLLVCIILWKHIVMIQLIISSNLLISNFSESISQHLEIETNQQQTIGSQQQTIGSQQEIIESQQEKIEQQQETIEKQQETIVSHDEKIHNQSKTSGISAEIRKDFQPSWSGFDLQKIVTISKKTWSYTSSFFWR